MFDQTCLDYEYKIRWTPNSEATSVLSVWKATCVMHGEQYKHWRNNISIYKPIWQVYPHLYSTSATYLSLLSLCWENQQVNNPYCHTAILLNIAVSGLSSDSCFFICIIQSNPYCDRVVLQRSEVLRDVPCGLEDKFIKMGWSTGTRRNYMFFWQTCTFIQCCCFYMLLWYQLLVFSEFISASKQQHITQVVSAFISRYVHGTNQSPSKHKHCVITPTDRVPQQDEQGRQWEKQ